MRKIGLAIAALVLSSLLATAHARTIQVEFLQGAINQQTIGALSGLSCRNYDKIVHLDIAVEWPSEKINAEKTGFKRLVFWTDDYEFLFPKGSYNYQHGYWLVKGYFIARSGGYHQGIASAAFEKVDDSSVMLNPNVSETKVVSSRCSP